MDSILKKLEHLEINLEEIKSATDNFNENKVIGIGGFGKVYKGERFDSEGQKRMVAFKRLNGEYGQGGREFFKEIRMLSCYRHDNISSLLGFCNERDEMILLYEYASHGSLDRHLNATTLTWIQRLKICLGAAKGLSFLHDPNGTQQRVLHCDIKSANILLDENLNAKVSDFGLSKMGPANQEYSLIVTKAVGTPGYCDPLYMETYSLTKESDVYSFGVVLFEVLCGKLCFERSNGRSKVYVPVWKKSFEENRLNDIIFKDLIQQMDPSSLETFAGIAYQCLKRVREERPLMSLVVEKLESALELQEFYDFKSQKGLYEEILIAADPPLKYKSLRELEAILSQGFFINGGKKWLSINEKGEHCERIYIEACLGPNKINDISRVLYKDSVKSSRFPGGYCYYYREKFKARVRAQYLSPQNSYAVNLVFRYQYESDVNYHNPLRYKLDGEDDTRVLTVYETYKREDGWFVAPLYHFTSQHKTAVLEFEFESRWIHLLAAGIEFQPSEEKAELHNPVFEEYQDIVKAASQSLVYTSLEELKKILFIGVYLNGYKTWLSLNDKGEHSEMISIKDCLILDEDYRGKYSSNPKSRFPAGYYIKETNRFKTNIITHFLSPNITYTVNLVFQSSSCYTQLYVGLKYRLRGKSECSTVHFAYYREDKLYVAELYQFTSNGRTIDLEIDFDDPGTIFCIEGILFQPLEIVEDQVLEDDRVEDIQTISDSNSDIYWEQKLPNDYEELLKLSKDSVQWTTRKELYSILCRGFMLDNGQQWFTVDKNGNKSQMLSARATCVIVDNNSVWESSYESRFGEVLVITAGYQFYIVRKIKSNLLVSPKTTYACYLVYKLPQDQSTFDAPLVVKYINPDWNYYWYFFLTSPPHTPVIGQMVDENKHNLLHRPKLNAIPQQRSDGWIEVKVWDFRIETPNETISMRLKLEHPGKKDLSGLMVQGIEIRPM